MSTYLEDRKRVRITTTNATPTTLLSYAVPSNSGLMMVGSIIVHGTLSNTYWTAYIVKSWKNISGTLTMVDGTTTKALFATETGFGSGDPAITPAISGTNAVLTATGNENANQWMAYIDLFLFTP